ncbi:hypothetical protein LIER_25343 [Lithospermum erythrorhizon]|uniref:Uncharacterized protein n=1 Tax=Lithospermum erythrorhizon TaxID=34254 RepID=A0AAV3R4F8_LITER
MQGIIEEDQLESFHIPVYTPSPNEIALVVEEEGSFTINYVGSFEIHWSNASKNECSSYESTINSDDDDTTNLMNAANLMNAVRSVTEPMLLDHFHGVGMDEIFIRFQKKISDCMAKEKTVNINVVVSMEKNIK